MITPHIDDLTDGQLWARGVMAYQTEIVGYDSDGDPEYSQSVYRRFMFQLIDDVYCEDTVCGIWGCPNAF